MDASVHDGWADVIDSALAQLVDDAGLDIAFGARVQPDGQRLVISRLYGARTAVLRNLVVLKGTGLGGKAMALGRPVTVTDYARADGISHQYDLPVAREGLHAMLAVPLLTEGRVSGVCYAALRQRLDIGERVQRLAVAVARRAEERLTADLRARQRRPAPADTRLRDTYRDLGSLLARIHDPAVRAELEGIRHRMLADAEGGAQSPRHAAALSQREHEALRCAALGLANTEIAELMGLSPGTVKAYLRSVMRKLGSRNRMEAVNTARTMGYRL
ncbi:LuxR C-terminal-related transcriptional regulator [Streptomyces sp. NBC_01537]|uniref:LuxR C-terminal-related transcriptional regulator n=1 Tax=Streptomyces sp. NBC_01537 TaxID=2903896 RepID=UPI00386F8AA0